ncbi:DNA helicase [Mesorhizobium sp. M7A.F.Ca.US.011.01.1.1]|uniref:UvrD-helicase domain-containing protein n=1 Tax=Mesorhizobium sp. M7A.F.Ca.US.011.01.1.1 TaxID=2496741 RepID=UPI000FC99FA6|nr:UvrD-helicase domain-containing protein [Mesorhizobium sp. M7A.F.Ca.US.011.01.1.1]RUX25825.1 DNA helicase [Mesorhizobium sp. M7A.F.Ca.US.011.01.1.1]
MKRPFISLRIDQLETMLEKATANGDSKAIKAIASEAAVRSTSRAGKLLVRAKSALDVKQADLFEKAPKKHAGVMHTKAPAKRGNRKPTAEQEQAIDAFLSGGSLRINAYAGTGKTSTLQFLAHGTRSRGQYIAFNKAIVGDAREKFPSTVDCSTTHSLALKSLHSDYKKTKDKFAGKVSAKQLAEILELKKAWRVDRDHSLQPVSQAYLIQQTLRRFAQSGDEEISDAHVPRHGSLLAASDETLNAVNEFARNNAKHLWGRMCDAKDAIPLGFDGFLKLWSLSKPQIAADYILLDEAQDTNPVVLDVLKRQNAQLIYVGDRYQQIYEWRGAINAMEAIETDAVVSLTRSFRFGPEIAHEASRILQRLGESVPLTGNPALSSRIGTCKPNAILARTNANVMTALIECIDEGRKPHLVGDNNDLKELLWGVRDLKEGRPTDVADFFGFNSWESVVDFAKTAEGEHLTMFVNLVQSKGEKRLLWAINQSVGEDQADIVISTAHKAKGREWKNVRLMDDFLKTRAAKGHEEGADREREDAAELRLFYVAVTRAKEAIEIPAMGDKAEPLRASARSSRQTTPGSTETVFAQPVDWTEPPKQNRQQAQSQHATHKESKRGFFSRLFGR